MRVLQVNCWDLLGSRFNGREINKFLQKNGHDAYQCVWIKKGGDPKTWALLEGIRHSNRKLSPVDWINAGIEASERALSLQSLLYPWSLQLLFDHRFLGSDVVHYHLLHNGYFSLLTMPKLTRLKPSVWTIHDPWLMTGHCVYPYACGRWKTGCGECPDLKTFMPMWFDNTSYMFKVKKDILERSQVEIVVASRYMLEMASLSPILRNKQIHYIPFGVDLDVFKKIDKVAVRERYNIDPNSLVISFRNTSNEFKGLKYIMEALDRIDLANYPVPIVLLTIDRKGTYSLFNEKFKTVELGAVTDESTMADFYNCSDLFLMPSTAEAFGMMAIESMACGTPVIVFKGTSLPDVTFSPSGGVSVPMGDSEALYHAIHRLLMDSQERAAVGEAAIEIVREHYGFDSHAQKIMSVYEQAIRRREA